MGEETHWRWYLLQGLLLRQRRLQCSCRLLRHRDSHVRCGCIVHRLHQGALCRCSMGMAGCALQSTCVRFVISVRPLSRSRKCLRVNGTLLPGWRAVDVAETTASRVRFVWIICCAFWLEDCVTWIHLGPTNNGQVRAAVSGFSHFVPKK